MASQTGSKYESDSTSVHFIRLSAGRLAVAGTPTTAPVNSPVKVKVSKTNREFGLRPRGVRLSRTVGTAPDTFKRYSFLPVLTKTAFDGTGFAVGATITIDSIAWTIVGKISEDY